MDVSIAKTDREIRKPHQCLQLLYVWDQKSSTKAPKSTSGDAALTHTLSYHFAES